MFQIPGFFKLGGIHENGILEFLYNSDEVVFMKRCSGISGFVDEVHSIQEHMFWIFNITDGAIYEQDILEFLDFK
jgi:hypothetical protein